MSPRGLVYDHIVQGGGPGDLCGTNAVTVRDNPGKGTRILRPWSAGLFPAFVFHVPLCVIAVRTSCITIHIRCMIVTIFSTAFAIYT